MKAPKAAPSVVTDTIASFSALLVATLGKVRSMNCKTREFSVRPRRGNTHAVCPVPEEVCAAGERAPWRSARLWRRVEGGGACTAPRTGKAMAMSLLS